MSDSQYALYLFTSFPPSAPSSRYLTPDQSTSITLCVVGVSVTFSVVVAASVAFSVGAAVGDTVSCDFVVSVTLPSSYVYEIEVAADVLPFLTAFTDTI